MARGVYDEDALETKSPNVWNESFRPEEDPQS